MMYKGQSLNKESNPYKMTRSQTGVLMLSRQIQKVEKIVCDHARLKEKKRLTEMVGVLDTKIFKILRDHLGMTKASARWGSRIPMLLQEQPKKPELHWQTCSRWASIS